jgi:predicted ABC-type ATPase
MSRVADNGHDVPQDKLIARFPRTQRAIREAAKIADATIFTDNSRDEKRAFTVCHVQLGEQALYDLRAGDRTVAVVIQEWLDKVSPLGAA